MARMNNYNDLAELRGTSIPMFNQHGTALSQEEREAIAKKKGVCVKCGIKTHEIKMFKRAPLTTDHVYEGTCIRCNSNSVPLPILQVWEQKFKPSQAKKPNSKFRMAGRLATLSVQATGAPSNDSTQPRNPAPVLSAGGGAQGHRGQVQMAGGGGLQNQRLQPTITPNNVSTGSYSHAQHLRPKEQQRQPTSYSSVDGNNSVTSVGSTASSVRPPTVAVGSEVMMNEDYTGGKLEEESWQLVGMLREYKGQPEFLRPILHRLRNIGDGQAGSLYEIKDLMEMYSSDPRMMSVCCGTLWGVSSRSDSLKAEAAESGAVNILLDSLNNPAIQLEADFVKWAIGSIACIAHESECRKIVADSGAIDMILASLERLPKSAGVFEWSCRALHSLVFQYEDDVEPDALAIKDNVASIGEGDGISVIISAMKRHAGETVAQLWAIRLLWRLQDRGGNTSLSNKVIERIVKCGGIDVCSKILKTRSTNTVLYEATAALLYVLLVFVGNDDVGMAADCMGTTIRKMSDNPAHVELQLACCNLLSVLVPANRLLFKESDGLKAIVLSMASAIDNVELQRAATMVLWSVSYISAFFDFSYLIDTLEAVTAAQGAHSDDTQLLIAACGFIANVVTSSSVKSADIPYAIPIHAFGLNDGDPQLHDQAGRALGNICIQCPNLTKRIINSNGINSLVACLHSTSAKVLQAMYGALTSIAKIGDEYKMQIIEAGCFEMAFEHINSSVSFAITEKAMELLSIVVSSEHRPNVTMPDDIFVAVVQAMRSQISNSQDLELACGVLRNLLLVTIPGTTNINFSGVADYMSELINNRSLPVDLKCEACTVLWALTGKQSRQSASDLVTMFKSVLGVMGLYKGEEQLYNSALQSAASGALATITACMRDVSVQISAEDVEEMIAVVYMVMEYDLDNIELLERFLDAILNLSFFSDTMVIQCGGIVVVIDTMVAHESTEGIQERGCAILALLSSTENLQVNLCIAETDGIDMIVSALAIFSANPRIQIDACKALSHLSVDHESRMLIASQGGLILLVNAMQSNLDNVDLLEGACAALLNLSSDAEEQVLADSNIVDIVVNAMRYKPDAMRLQEKALGVLQNVSMRNAAAKMSIAEAGGINAVTIVIRDFMGTPSVLERAFTTMWSLAVLERNQVEIANAGGIPLVINGMMATINDGTVQKQGCGCLCTLSSNSRNKTLIREAGGVDAIVFAMWAHYNSEVLQIEACRALSSLAVNVQTNEVMIASDGEINAIICAMRLFPNSQKLQEHACVALRNFMLSSDNADLIRTNASELRHLMTHAARAFPEKCSERANQVLAGL